MKRRKKAGKGFLASLAEAVPVCYPMVQARPIPVRAEIAGKAGPLLPSLPAPEAAYHVYSEGEDGFQDSRTFVLREDGQGGWQMEGRWQASGNGAPPIFLSMLGQMLPLFNSVLNFGMRVDHRITRQEVDYGRPVSGYLRQVPGQEDRWEE